MVLAIWGGSFLEPSPWQWFFGAGIGTNIGASILWGLLAGFIGYFIAKKCRAAWTRLHSKLDAHQASLHARLDAHEELHRKHAEKLDAILAGLPVREAPRPHTTLHLEREDPK